MFQFIISNFDLYPFSPRLSTVHYLSLIDMHYDSTIMFSIFMMISSPSLIEAGISDCLQHKPIDLSPILAPLSSWLPTLHSLLSSWLVVLGTRRRPVFCPQSLLPNHYLDCANY